MIALYGMKDLNAAHDALHDAIRAGLAFDVVLTDLGCEAEFARDISRYSASCFLEVLFDELGIDVAEADLKESEQLEYVQQTWMAGLLVGLFLTVPTDGVTIRFPAFVGAMWKAQGVGRTLPVQLREIGLDTMDATEAAATVGAMARRNAGATEIPVDDWAALHARTWLDALMVARLIRIGFGDEDQDNESAL
ncbi:MAG: hypothetical protein WA484_13600 [Solirubrobacteraceae bacterium]